MDDAVDNRAHVINYPKVFVDCEPENEFELKMDIHLEEEMKTIEFQEALVHLTINKYLQFIEDGGVEHEPEEVKNGKESWIGTKEEISFIHKFMKQFEFTNKEEDFIESSKIQKWIDDYSVGISAKKMSMEIKKYSSINKFNNVENKYKKLDGKTVRIWIGIKLNF